MSNKLKRKQKLKPEGYEERFVMQQYRKNEKLSEDCFVEVFYSLKNISYTALWMDKADGGVDFSEADLKKFYECIKVYNDSFDDLGGMALALQEVYKRQIGFDCGEEARKFSLRAKLKMYGKKLKTKKDYEIAINSTTEAVEIYLVLAVHTLRKDFSFTGEMIRKWWNKCQEVAELYTRGMTDEFMEKYLEEETGIKIVEL